MRQSLQAVLKSADASIDQMSSFIDTESIFQMSAQAVVTGTSSGSLKLQFSNDILPKGAVPEITPTNWSDIPSANVVISGAGIFAIPKTDICYQYVQALYTHNNGSPGTITVNIKALGA